MTDSTRTLVMMEGDKTHLLRVVTDKIVKTDDFLARVQTTRAAVLTPILPVGCIQYKATTEGQNYAMVFPASNWVVAVQSAPAGTHFTITCPTTVIFAAVRGSVIDRVSVYFSREPKITETTELFHTALPNQYEDARCCMGSGFNEAATSPSLAIADKLSLIYPYLSTSLFNDDIYVPSERIPTEYKTAARTPVTSNVFYARHLNADHTLSLGLISRMHHWTAITPNPVQAVSSLAFSRAGRFNERFARS